MGNIDVKASYSKAGNHNNLNILEPEDHGDVMSTGDNGVIPTPKADRPILDGSGMRGDGCMPTIGIEGMTETCKHTNAVME